ncbi:CinA family protein [Zafaria sp. Z1313]|uniref:CinA family protein n=1 Tax=unclassified Zafaria TaxID=2828765 RepID=UPI002E779E51|nr:CinA family protein [Zafaria sp. J156]MEE1621966.1 CinA family protein [Zafaria sp. J156]
MTTRPAAQGLVERAAALGLTVATAESLTAGMVAAAIADVPGSSAVLRGGVVSYHNDVKHGLLGVDERLLAERGSVDPVVAEQMASGARRACGADYAVATTGVAGPAAHDGREVGTVYLGHAGPGGSGSRELRLDGGRQEIRAAARDAALALLGSLLPQAPPST